MPTAVAGVFVRMLGVKMGDATDSSPQVVVAVDGGDWGQVRVLVLGK